MRNRVPIPKHVANGKATRNGKAHNGPSTTVCDGADTTKPTPQPAPKPPAQPAPTAERTANGQFAKGNKCSLGNPFARRLGALRSAFLNAVTDADVGAVVRKLADLAASGDVQAAALFLSYAVGKPLPAVNPDRLDLDGFAIMDAIPTRARAVVAMYNAVDPIVLAALSQSLIPNELIPPDLDALTAALKRMDKHDASRVSAEEDARIGKPVG
jgi:hypothetical protein